MVCVIFNRFLVKRLSPALSVPSSTPCLNSISCFPNVPARNSAFASRQSNLYPQLMTRSRQFQVFLYAFSMLIPSPSAAAEEQTVLRVWPGATAGDFGTIGPERVRAPSEAPTKDAKWITNVKDPTITVFRAVAEKNTGVAVIVCPGGGYWNLAWDLEGEEVAKWFNDAGVNSVVLKYRVPRRSGQPERLPAPGPLLDAQRTVSLVRSHASEWGIDPQKIGIIGFSAGGHLAVSTATHFDERGYEPVDEIDKVSCRPDFAGAIYPGYLIEQARAGVEEKKDVLAPYMRIPKDTPPIFLVHANDDSMAGAENSLVMYMALKRANIPAELHLYAQGEHGFGVRKNDLPCSTWPERFIDWLKAQGMIRPSGATK
jgi:acetyl esterase/lipase